MIDQISFKQFSYNIFVCGACIHIITFNSYACLLLLVLDIALVTCSCKYSFLSYKVGLITISVVLLSLWFPEK